MEVKNSFKKFDIDHRNELTKHQLDGLFKDLNIILSTQQSNDLFNAIDTDKNGAVDINELMTYLRSDNSENKDTIVAIKRAGKVDPLEYLKTFSSMPSHFKESFLRKLNKNNLNLPACMLIPQINS